MNVGQLINKLQEIIGDLEQFDSEESVNLLFGCRGTRLLDLPCKVKKCGNCSY